MIVIITVIVDNKDAVNLPKPEHSSIPEALERARAVCRQGDGLSQPLFHPGPGAFPINLTKFIANRVEASFCLAHLGRVGCAQVAEALVGVIIVKEDIHGITTVDPILLNPNHQPMLKGLDSRLGAAFTTVPRVRAAEIGLNFRVVGPHFAKAANRDFFAGDGLRRDGSGHRRRGGSGDDGFGGVRRFHGQCTQVSRGFNHTGRDPDCFAFIDDSHPGQIIIASYRGESGFSRSITDDLIISAGSLTQVGPS